MSRWGHEGNICPLLALIPPALLLWAGFWRAADAPLQEARPRPVRALMAGLLTGVCCYGYPAVRAFIPAMLVLAAIFTWRYWRDLLRRWPAALAAVAAFLFGLALTFGPLLYAHLTDSGINRRGGSQFMWRQNYYKDHLAASLALRYLQHFNPLNLFRQVVPANISHMGCGFGWFHIYGLGLMAAGAVWMVLQRSSLAARILLAGLLAYPLGDTLSNTDGGLPHPLRSGPGGGYLVLLEAVGAVVLITWAARLKRPLRLSAAVAAAAIFAVSNVLFVYALLVSYNRDPAVYYDNNAPFRQAGEYLRTMKPQPDAVFFTSAQSEHLPYLPLLVTLRYDPHRWFAAPKSFISFFEFDACTRFDKYYFNYGPECQAQLDGLINSKRRYAIALVTLPDEYETVRATCNLTRLLDIRDGQGNLALIVSATVVNPDCPPAYEE